MQSSRQVKFADGSSRNFDYILQATGYTSGQGEQHVTRTSVAVYPSYPRSFPLLPGPHTKFLEKKVTSTLLNEYGVINSGVEVRDALRSACVSLLSPLLPVH
jgi:hypothetical protein